MPAIKRGGRGHPRRRPIKLHSDKGYDVPRERSYLPRRGITARIAPIGRDSSVCLGRHRWVVERTLGWLLSHKRLALRYDRTARPSPRWPDWRSPSSAPDGCRRTDATSSWRHRLRSS